MDAAPGRLALSDRDPEEHGYEQNTKVKRLEKQRCIQPIYCRMLATFSRQRCFLAMSKRLAAIWRSAVASTVSKCEGVGLRIEVLRMLYSALIQELDLSYARTSDGATPATWASRTNSATDVTPIFSITRPR